MKRRNPLRLNVTERTGVRRAEVMSGADVGGSSNRSMFHYCKEIMTMGGERIRQGSVKRRQDGRIGLGTGGLSLGAECGIFCVC